jgi:cysteine desulfurase/selenocysteine lyase
MNAPDKMKRTNGLDLDRIRADFPILKLKVNGKPLVFLDNAASSQMPQPVLDRWVRYQTTQHSNIHRAVHHLSEVATAEYEVARKKLQAFINAKEDREVIFTTGTTDAINLVAHGYGRKFIGAGDEIVLTTLEHHSNIVPWQMVAEEKGAKIRVVPVNDRGELDHEAYLKLLGPRTKIVGVGHVSNALGTINPIREMIEAAHAKGIPVLVDGAQAAPHVKLDMQALGCDFYAFSGHKLFGPTGIGVLYGREHLLEGMPPYQGGGGMISAVTFEQTGYSGLPHKFEAGTPHAAGALGLAAAIEYVTAIGLDRVRDRERGLLAYGTSALSEVPGLRFTGTAPDKAGIMAFTIDRVHPHDIGTILDRAGVAIRAGHHCCQPLMARLGVAATARASLAVYNTRDEIDVLARALYGVRELFA